MVTFKVIGVNLAIYPTNTGHWIIQKAEDKPLYKPKDPNNITILLDGDEISFDSQRLSTPTPL